MKVKNVHLEYNVLIYDWNFKKVKNHNVLRYLDLKDIRKKVLKKEISSYDEFKEYLTKKFKYFFWGRAEFEIMVGDLICTDFEKIDAWRQIEMNLDMIVKYIMDEMKIKFEV